MSVTYAQLCLRPARHSLMGIGLVSLAILGLVLATFVQWHIPDTVDTMGLLPEHYVATIPVMLAIAACLGPWLGGWVSVIYLALGLFALPLFANGGGMNYWQESGFSYLIGLPFGAWSCGRFYQRGQQAAHWWQLLALTGLAVVTAIISIHLVGAVGLCVQSCLGYMDASALSGWLRTLSLQPVLMDTLLTTVLLSTVVPALRYALWWLL